ncbi:MAG: hypothetical protein AB4041_04920 [Microcystaceae cyanobacterium]
MNLDTFQPYLKYLGFGTLAILGVIILLWLILVFIVTKGTKEIPKVINNFIGYIGENQLDISYQMTTHRFRKGMSKAQLKKFIKTHKIKTYQRLILGIPKMENDSQAASVTVNIILKSGKEIPTVINLVKEEKEWLIDGFKLDKSPSNK